MAFTMLPDQTQAIKDAYFRGDSAIEITQNMQFMFPLVPFQNYWGFYDPAGTGYDNTECPLVTATGIPIIGASTSQIWSSLPVSMLTFEDRNGVYTISPRATITQGLVPPITIYAQPFTYSAFYSSYLDLPGVTRTFGPAMRQGGPGGVIILRPYAWEIERLSFTLWLRTPPPAVSPRNPYVSSVLRLYPYATATPTVVKVISVQGRKRASLVLRGTLANNVTVYISGISLASMSPYNLDTVAAPTDVPLAGPQVLNMTVSPWSLTLQNLEDYAYLLVYANVPVAPGGGPQALDLQYCLID